MSRARGKKTKMRQITKGEDKEKYLLEAFEKLAESDILVHARLTIEEEFKRFTAHLEKVLKPNQMIFENVESRIKGVDSFREKIYRKDYVRSWTVYDDVEHNKTTIKKNLPDLIGFRITCFFWSDEKSIYDELCACAKNGFFKKFTINTNENCKQKNNKPIYKVSGLYDDSVCFELQIKSIMHNIWGEVEHKTIYKNREYDPTIANKKAFTEQIFNILQASDQQLHTLFDESYSEDKLMQAYFFQKTKDQIMKRSKTNILAEHYDRFFALFGDKTDKDYVDQYVKTAIQDKRFKRMAVDEITLSDKGIRLVREMEKTFYVYDLKMLYYIADILYQFKNYGHFLSYWAERLLKDYYLESESTVEEYDMFDEEEEETTATENTVVTEIIKILKNKIGRDRE